MQKSNKNQPRIAGVFNFAPHYRLPIFQKLAEGLKMDYFFGDQLLTDVKPLDYNLLKGFQRILPTKYIRRFYYNKGVFSLLCSKKYSTYIFTGEMKNLSAWTALLLKVFKPKLKVMLWMHGLYGSEKGLDKFIKLRMYHLADHLFLYGDYAKQLLIAEGFKPSKLTTVYNTLDYERQLEIRSTLTLEDIYHKHFNNNQPTICYIGRLQAIKRIDWLILLIVELKKKNMPSNLILIGDGEERSELERMAKQLGVEESIWFYGASYDELELAKLLFNATVCVSPGNVGLTAMHSLVYGCPVITHRNFKAQMPEFEAITEDETGSFYEENNFKDLVDVVTSWLEQSNSNLELRNSIRKACYEVIDKKYNPEFQLKAFQSILKD